MSSFNRGLSTGNVKIDNKIKNLGKKNVNSTAGAIVTTNEKGETTMEKVKVKRYIAGKIPEFKSDDTIAKPSSTFLKIKPESVIQENYYTVREDLSNRINEFNIGDQQTHADHIYSRNEIKLNLNRKQNEEDDKFQNEFFESTQDPGTSSIDEQSQDEAALRRRLMKEKLLARQQQMQPNTAAQLASAANGTILGAEENDDEYEYYTSEEEEEYSDDAGVSVPRLKPVFVRKEDRVTLHDHQSDAINSAVNSLYSNNQALLLERRKESRRMVSTIRKEELVDEQNVDNFDQVVITDDEDDEAEFEAWKLRELKRMKRDIEERQELENERIELEKIRNMSEKERIKYFEQNPKLVTNQASKGTYKYLQKYYHRGAFFLDREDDIFKRNYDAPTLEDHFDKSVLPAYLQIKNFGKVGRTKYTHLTDQDTTDHLLNRDEASANIPAFQQKFHSKISAGSKQVFEKPSLKRKRTIGDN